MSADYHEETNLHLEDAILTLHLLLHSVWQSDDCILHDFKTVVEAVLTNVRSVFCVMAKYEQRGSVDQDAEFVR